jgi:hypothetical protein
VVPAAAPPPLPPPPFVPALPEPFPDVPHAAIVAVAIATATVTRNPLDLDAAFRE